MAHPRKRRGAPASGLAYRWLRLCVVVLIWALIGSANDASAAPPVPRASVEHAQRAAVYPAAGSEPEARVESVDVRLTIWRGRGERPPQGWEDERPDRYAARVDGHASYELDRPGAAGEARVLRLLDYATAMGREPLELDALTFSAYQGGPWSESSTRVIEAVNEKGEVLVTHRVGTGSEITVELTPGTRRVNLRYRVRVPRRYWPLGCVRNRCSLSGALAPLPSEAAHGGAYLPEQGRVVSPVEWTVESVRFGDVPDWRPGADPTPQQEKKLKGDEIVITDADAMSRSYYGYPSIFWGKAWRRHHFVYQGVDVQVLHMDRRPAATYPHETKLQYRADVAGNLDAIARETIDAAYELGLRPPAGADMFLIQGPIRSDVAQGHPTAVVVSDEYLNVLPVAPARRFHHEQVARAVLDHMSLSYFTPHQDASERLWVAGAVAYGLMRAWQAKRDLPDEDARDLLRNLSFMPAVDSFLYRGQATFASAYFRGSEDKRPVRNHPLWFAHELPTGRRIYEKLNDYFDDETLSAFLAGCVRTPAASAVSVAEEKWGRRLDWFFDQWLGRYPETDYAILDMETEALADGRFRHRIRVGRDTSEPLIEPLQVVVVENGGKRHYLIWNGEGAPGKSLAEQPRQVEKTFEFETERRVKYVTLDPRFRSAEVSRIPSSPGGRPDNNDPRFNNRRPGDGRFIYSGFGFNVAASEFLNAETPRAKANAISGLFAFEAGVRRDLRYNGTFIIFKDRETLAGVSGAANFFFLEKIHGQRRRLRLRNNYAISWLGEDGAIDDRGGVRLQETVSLSDDNRRFRHWPDQGHRAAVGLRFSQVLRLENDRSDDRHDVSAFVDYTQLIRLAHDHVLATRLQGELVVPLKNELEYRALPRVGGLGGLSGFTADEVFGRVVLETQVEYRHVFVNDLRFNFANFAWIRSLGGALFAGAATFSSCAEYRSLGAPGHWRGQVGYGLTAYMHYLGVAPQLLRVEAAVPLGRARSACLGKVFPDALAEAQGLPGSAAQSLLPPVNINVLFTQPF